MKKKLCALLTMAVLMLYGIFGTAAEQPEVDGDINFEVGEQIFKFLRYDIGTDYEGNLAIILSFDYTNNSEEANMAARDFDVQIFQNGIEKDSCTIDFDSKWGEWKKNLTTNLKDGATLTACRSFLLDDAQARVDVEVSELVNFDETQKMTIDISQYSGGVPEINSETEQIETFEAEYTEMSENYSSLQSEHEALQSEHEALQLKYDALTEEKDEEWENNSEIIANVTELTEMKNYEVGNVTIDIPVDWRHKPGKGNMSYFYPPEGTVDGEIFSVLAVSYIIIEGAEDYSSEDIENGFDEAVEGIKESSVEYIDSIKNFEINGMQAREVFGKQKIDEKDCDVTMNLFLNKEYLITVEFIEYKPCNVNYSRALEKILYSISSNVSDYSEDEGVDGVGKEAVEQINTTKTEEMIQSELAGIEKNTSVALDQISILAKNKAAEVSDMEIEEAISAIRDNYPQYYNGPEQMELYMYYGYLLDFAFDDSDPRSALGMDTYQAIKYVYRGVETVLDSSTKENLEQIKNDLQRIQ